VPVRFQASGRSRVRGQASGQSFVHVSILSLFLRFYDWIFFELF
jgi:hypothetical protein